MIISIWVGRGIGCWQGRGLPLLQLTMPETEEDTNGSTCSRKKDGDSYTGANSNDKRVIGAG